MKLSLTKQFIYIVLLLITTLSKKDITAAVQEAKKHENVLERISTLENLLEPELDDMTEWKDYLTIACIMSLSYMS